MSATAKRRRAVERVEGGAALRAEHRFPRRRERCAGPRGAAAAAAALLALALLPACGDGGEAEEARRAAAFQGPSANGAAPDPGIAPASTPAGLTALAEAPAATSFGQDALLYRIGESPCAVLRAGLDGLSAGLCGEELQPRVYVRPDRPMRLAELVARYAPFELEVGDEEVELHGHGSEEAGPVERRMVLEWARRLMAEARGVTATRGFRLAYEWHRQIQGGRDCEAVAIYLSGEAFATTCSDLRAAGHVEGNRMAAILAWHDQVAPFQAVRQGGAGGEAVADRIFFPGAGEAEQDDETVKTMIALARAIHADVLARQLARQRAEQEREAALEAARLEETQAAERQTAAARPWVPPSVVEEQGELTLNEAIAVGADPEAVEEVAPRAGGEVEEEEGDGGGGGAGAAGAGGADGGGVGGAADDDPEDDGAA
jgi:hypothetical protein